MPHDPLSTYEELQEVFSQDVKGEANQALIGRLYEASCRFLSKAQTRDLKSIVPGKEYFAFAAGKKLSRAVNKRLFVADTKEWEAFRKAIATKKAPDMDADRITRIIYSVAVSFFCKKKLEVIEICLPEQWRIYQMHIAQLRRIYYLDLPISYAKLNEVFPPLSVKALGHFFAEADILPT